MKKLQQKLSKPLLVIFFINPCVEWKSISEKYEYSTNIQFQNKKCFERKNKQAHIPDATPLLDIDTYNE